MKTNTQAALNKLAARASELHGQSVKAWMDCAATLAEAHEIADHGQWLSFLEQAGIGIRTSQRMLRIAKAGLKYDTMTHLGGVSATLDYLSAVDAARANWRAELAETEPGTLEYSRIMQAVPDGLESGIAWCDTNKQKQAIVRAYGYEINYDRPRATADGEIEGD